MINLKKKLSQNFLTDNNIKKNILKYINIKSDDIILEIGCGDGSLSKNISELAKESHFVEIDKTLIKELKKNINLNKSYVYNEDILKFNINDFLKKYKKIRIIGNLPYKISTKILLKLTEFSKHIKDAHFVIQKEIAEKITLKCDNKKYGKTSLLLQNFFYIKKIFDIKPTSFYPIPKVTSTLISLIPKKTNCNIKNNFLFNKIITNAFNNRRKKIYKSINSLKTHKDINLNKRPENLNNDDFIQLYEILKNKTEDYYK